MQLKIMIIFEKYAPIALFCYKRPDHLRRTVEALIHNKLAKKSKLYIFIDGAKTQSEIQYVEKVGTFCRSITGFRSVTIIERSHNMGLSQNIISGVTEIVRKYGKIIVLEDDLITSPFFLQYMNDALDLYANQNRVASIHGYIYPTKKSLPETFFLRGADCWGWATWKRAWIHFEPDGKKLLHKLNKSKQSQIFDLDGAYPYTNMLHKQSLGKLDSWAIRWYASAFLDEMYTLYPGSSLIHNIAIDNSGTNSRASSAYDQIVSLSPLRVDLLPIEEDTNVRKIVAESIKKARMRHIISIVKNMFTYSK